MLKELKRDEFMAQFDPSVHGAIDELVETFKSPFVVCSECQDMCSSSFGRRKALCVGPLNMVPSLFSAETGQIDVQLSSTIKLPTNFMRTKHGEKTCWCGHEPTVTQGPGVGYGRDAEGRTRCYACCGKHDEATMCEKGHSKNLPLYLSYTYVDLESENGKAERIKQAYGFMGPKVYREPTGPSRVAPSGCYFDFVIGNWPGTLTFKATGVTRGRHNWGIPRWDVWFNGPDGHVWHGVNYGNNTQIVHCRRTAKRWKKD